MKKDSFPFVQASKADLFNRWFEIRAQIESPTLIFRFSPLLVQCPNLKNTVAIKSNLRDGNKAED